LISTNNNYENNKDIKNFLQLTGTYYTLHLKEKMIKLDKINKKILIILQKDGSITNADLAKRVGLAPASTLERVKKLETAGVIRKYVCLVDQEKVGRDITVFVEVSLAIHTASSIESFTREIISFPEVLECHHVAGDKDFLLKVVAGDIAQYRDFALDKLARLEGIGKVQTLFSMKTVKNSTLIPIDP